MGGGYDLQLVIKEPDIPGDRPVYLQKRLDPLDDVLSTATLSSAPQKEAAPVPGRRDR